MKQKKFRKLHGAFVVEGTKSVAEFIRSEYEVQSLFITPDTLAKMDKIPQNIEFFEISEAELRKISNLTTPQGVLAVVRIPDDMQNDQLLARQGDDKPGFTLVLDDVQDPGNLGTIIRTADWFGINTVICSVGSVDAYNPKTVQASMGSLARLRVLYVDLATLFASSSQTVFGAVLDGKSIYEVDFGKQGYILLGNEGQGISSKIQSFIQQPVTIPRSGGAESLNVAITAALFCAELARRRISGN